MGLYEWLLLRRAEEARYGPILLLIYIVSMHSSVRLSQSSCFAFGSFNLYSMLYVVEVFLLEFSFLSYLQNTF